MSDLLVYDKAKYHFEGDFPEGVSSDQAYVHIGMFLGWLCDHQLLSDQMLEDFADEIDQYRRRNISGARLLKLAGGTLASDMLNAKGNAFTQTYFEPEKGLYLGDYSEVLAKSLTSIYHTEDTWSNYERLSARIDERYRQFLEKEGRQN